MTILEGSHTGVFDLPDGRKVFGVLEVEGRTSNLVLHDEHDFPPVPEAFRTLYGVLHDGTHVALVNCALLSINRKHTQSEKRFSAKIFPNTIVSGPRSIASCSDQAISCALLLSDVSSIFYAFDTFSTILDPSPFIPLLIADKAHIRTPTLGNQPVIGYFNGLFEIAQAKTAIGVVTAKYRVNESMGGPHGWHVAGQIWVSIDFDDAVGMSEALHRSHVVARFFDLLCGRKQELKDHEIRYACQPGREESFNVYEAHAHRVSDAKEVELSGRRNPGPRDVLICTADGSDSYARVIERYIERDTSWGESRGRLRDGMGRGSYSIDRVVSAANLFDILPASAVPGELLVSEELQQATDCAKKLFKKLPESIERNSILSALGRVGKASLKQKVLYRMRLARLDDFFEDLSMVLQEAVDCRNHYVHGSPAPIDYANNFEAVVFLTDALEFVFGVSDLVECGWDLRSWIDENPQDDHPFGGFFLSYRQRLRRFKALMP